MMPAKSYIRNAKEIVGLMDAVKKVADTERPEIAAAGVEFVLKGLHVNKRLNKTKSEGKVSYRR